VLMSFEAETALETALEIAQTLAPDKLPRFLGQLEEVRATALSRLTAVPAPVRQEAARDTLLNVKDAARTLGLSAGYVYRHHKEEPFRSFARPFGRKLLFSSHGIQSYLTGKCRR